MHALGSLRVLMHFAVISTVAATEVNNDRNVVPRAIDWGSLRCDGGQGAGAANLPTPTYGTEKAVFKVCSQVAINAPPAAVYSALLDFQSYPLWNSFVVDVTLPNDVRKTPDDLYVGAKMVFKTKGIIPYINTTSTEIITAMDDTQPGEYLMVSWRSDDGLGGTLHRAEHPTILVDQGDGTTLSVSYEPYYPGLLTPALQLMQGTLQKLFEQQNQDLKAYVEGKQK